MPSLGALAIAMLVQAAVPVQQVPVHGVTPGHRCNVHSADKFIGRLASPSVRDSILRSSNAALLRWAPPHTMLTMDFRSDRVTVYLNSLHRVTKISCG